MVGIYDKKMYNKKRLKGSSAFVRDILCVELPVCHDVPPAHLRIHLHAVQSGYVKELYDDN